MTTPRNIAADQLSALLALLQQKRFSEVLNATKGMSEYPEASVLSSLALIGEGKLYAANAALKSWITNINERRLFANLAKTAGLNWDVILRFLMSCFIRDVVLKDDILRAG